MEPAAGIYARYSSYLDRVVQIGVVGNRLIAVSFPRDHPEEADSEHQILDSIERYLDGIEESFADVELALTVGTETRAVLETVREIPYGHQRDVETIAKMTPQIDVDATETVQQALRENPVPPVIPDHRVSDGPHAAPTGVVERFRALEGLE